MPRKYFVIDLGKLGIFLYYFFKWMLVGIISYKSKCFILLLSTLKFLKLYFLKRRKLLKIGRHGPLFL